MNKLEKYAVKRIALLNENMDYINSRMQQEYKKPESIIDFQVIQEMDRDYTAHKSEIHEIACCLLEQPADDLPF